ncbi:hypothetical protein Tco_1230752, partial [Tanacetum coccineum]
MDEGTKNYSFDRIFTRSNPSVLVDKTKFAEDGLKTAHTNSGANEESRADDISLKVKLEDLSHILKDTRSAFFTPDSLPDVPIIFSDESKEEDEVLTKLLVTSLKPELSKLLASHDFASCLPIELKELPSKIIGLSREIKELQKHIRDMEIELLGDLKDIPTRTFIGNFQQSFLICQVKFATMVENASGAISMNVPSVGKAIASHAEGEKNTKDADTNLKDELVDLLGKNVV